jgi:predicted membrane protein
MFSVVFIGLSVAWVFVLAVLMLLGFIIGVIIGFLILLYLIGLLNMVLTDVIWNIETKDDWKSLFSHGFFLFIALVFVQIPAFLINLVVHNLAITIALFIVYCFIDGYVSKTVAESYKTKEHEPGETTEYNEPTKPPWIHTQ